MLARNTRLRSNSLANYEVKARPFSTFSPPSGGSDYSHVSTFRYVQHYYSIPTHHRHKRDSSLYMELRIFSPSTMLIPYLHTSIKRSLPIFGDNDHVGGYVILNPSCSPAGRLLISVRCQVHIPLPELMIGHEA